MAIYDFAQHAGRLIAFDAAVDVLSFDMLPAGSLVFLQVGDDLRISLGAKRITLKSTSYEQIVSQNLIFTNGSVALFGTQKDETLTVPASAFSRSNYIDGRDGDDFIRAGRGNNVIRGGDGNDRLIGHDGRSILNGNAGNDYIDSALFLGVDTLIGGRGDDRIFSDLNGDVIDGGEGIDMLTVAVRNASAGLQIALFAKGEIHAKLGKSAPESIRSIEQLTLIGTRYEDLVVGGRRTDVLFGNEGNDTLDGGAGNDFIEGGDGDDVLIGGDGEDNLQDYSGHNRIEGGSGSDRIAVGMSWSTNSAEIDGGTGTDQLILSLVSDTSLPEIRHASVSLGQVAGEVGHVTIDNRVVGKIVNVERVDISGGNGNDTLSGSTGNDEIWGNIGHDRLRGEAGNDVLHGDNGRDTIVGGGGNDLIEGGFDNDYLVGSDGNDTLIGGWGDDDLTGGVGTDLFRLEGDMGSLSPPDEDTIRDFKRSEGDKIELLFGFIEQRELPFVFTDAFTGRSNELIRTSSADAKSYSLRVDANGDRIEDLSVRIFSPVAIELSDLIFVP